MSWNADLATLNSRIDALVNFNEFLNEQKLTEALENLKHFRNICARSSDYQDFLVSNETLQNYLRGLIFSDDSDNNTTAHVVEQVEQQKHKLRIIAWQLIANITVQNPHTQKCIWQLYGDLILQNLDKPPIDHIKNIQLMLIYNMFKSEIRLLSEGQALRAVVTVWSAIIENRSCDNFDYLHFLFEHFLVNDGRITVCNYAKLTTQERVAFLDYVASYIRNDSPNGLIHAFLLQYFTKEFKIKSDCILRQTAKAGTEIEQMKPREAFGLLRVIAGASGSDVYAHIFAKDHALFLNVSSLLRCLIAAGKESNSIFAPMNKLEEVAVTSKIPWDFETEISFDLKSLLVRCIANLLYKNRTNQQYCLDTQVMPALFDCTTMDARNPVIKEWAILAIRNACADCPEIQQIIANLSQKAPAPNDILTELNLNMGSLRIRPQE